MKVFRDNIHKIKLSTKLLESPTQIRTMESHNKPILHLSGTWTERNSRIGHIAVKSLDFILFGLRKKADPILIYSRRQWSLFLYFVGYSKNKYLV